jgi:hypothetical protein
MQPGVAKLKVNQKSLNVAKELQWNPLNVITLGQIQTDHNDQKKTLQYL